MCHTCQLLYHCHLLDIVKIRIEQKYPNDESKLQLPSLEWLRLQFWLRNPYSSSALLHTGRIDLKFGVQVRQLCQDHVDSHYVSVLLQYLKEFSVQQRDFATYISIDDKAIIPVGNQAILFQVVSEDTIDQLFWQMAQVL